MTPNTTIWKFPLTHILTNGGHGSIFIPEAATIVHFAIQDKEFCLWALVNPLNDIHERYFTLVGTGHDIPDGGWYTGTVHQPPFVWHLFEESLVDAV